MAALLKLFDFRDKNLPKEGPYLALDRTNSIREQALLLIPCNHDGTRLPLNTSKLKSIPPPMRALFQLLWPYRKSAHLSIPPELYTTILPQLEIAIDPHLRREIIKINLQTVYKFKLQVGLNSHEVEVRGLFTNTISSLTPTQIDLILPNGIMLVNRQIISYRPLPLFKLLHWLQKKPIIKFSNKKRALRHLINCLDKSVLQLPPEINIQEISTSPTIILQISNITDADFQGKISLQYGKKRFGLFSRKKIVGIVDNTYYLRSLEKHPLNEIKRWGILSPRTGNISIPLHRFWEIATKIIAHKGEVWLPRPKSNDAKSSSNRPSEIDWWDKFNRLEQFALPPILQRYQENKNFLKFSQIESLNAIFPRLFKSHDMNTSNHLINEKNYSAIPSGWKGEFIQCSPSSRFKGNLHRYQQIGLGWLLFLAKMGLGGCLADDMGLGKTVQLLAFLDLHSKAFPALIVVPKTLIENWRRESQHFVPHLHRSTYFGPDRHSLREDLEKKQIIITSYGTVKRDIAHLKEINFKCIIIDEAQTIKNPHSQVAHVIKQLKAPHRFALSGTPIENRVRDFRSIFEFINPTLNPKKSFKFFRPFILRRTKEEILPDLPRKHEITLYCQMPPRQKKIYYQIKGYYRLQLEKYRAEQNFHAYRLKLIEGLLRLRQVACHPRLLEYAYSPSCKINALIAKLKQLGGHKALVFSQFTSLLALVKKELDSHQIRYQYLDGKTKDRLARVDSFQKNPEYTVFLLSLKAGGVGLNLTAASYCFLLDPWWNPSVEAQAIDRAHRLGQTQKVTAYRLITKDTVEEKMLVLQKNKKDLADKLIFSDQSFLSQLKQEDFEFLIS